MKIRLSVLALSLTWLPTVAAAQAGGQSIAYVKSVSNGDEIYLVNPDGTGLIRVYKARSKTQITMLDLRPTGGEVAFTENHRSLKILAFDQYGRALPGNPREISLVSSPCTVESPDFHANGTLLFVEGCGRDRRAWTVQSGAAQRDGASLFSAAVFRARWSRLGDSIFYVGLRDNASTSDPTYLYRRSSSPSGTPDELGILNSWSTFDVARQGERLFWSTGNGTFKLLDLATAGVTTNDATDLQCPRGMRMAYAAGDASFVYTTTASKGGNYVMVGPSDCGTPSALTGKGSWGWVDWRSE